MLNWEKELWQVGAVTFPSSFSEAGFALALGTDVPQLVSKFLTKGINCIVIVTELVSQW